MSFRASIILLSFLFLQENLAASLHYDIPDMLEEKDSTFWFSKGRDELEAALKKPVIDQVAKNVIVFIGDGMGITASTAGRIFKGQKKGHSGEEEYLTWEKFPNTALIKTYDLDKQVADSASTATAIFGGIKSNFYTLGLNGNAKHKDCAASLVPENKVDSILKWSQDAGKGTGIVSTARVTHATPAALYAHSPDRDWECDMGLSSEEEVSTEGCRDIAVQLIEDSPGNEVNVIFAGGRRQMGASVDGDEDDSCLRNDSRNLAEEWLAQKKSQGKSAEYVSNAEDFNGLDVENLDFVMGLFGAGHMPFSFEQEMNPEKSPTLEQMTKAAIKRLQKDPNGFFLMVEAGRIDHALHYSRPRVALEEVLALDEAVQVALDMTDREDTLIIVTADHSHVMTINGYPERGNDILGTTTYEKVTDDLPYTTLMFTNGPGANFTWDGSQVERANITGIDTTSHYFVSQSVVPSTSETHGGEDVALYATGPMSHLFHALHEQSYIAHVLAYASCVGHFEQDCAGNR